MFKKIAMVISVLLFALALTLGLMAGDDILVYVESMLTEKTPEKPTPEITAGKDTYVDVYLEADEHCTVLSENPKRVKYGYTAKFQVVFHENYTVAETNARYENGYVYVENCTVGATYHITTKEINQYCYFDYVLPAESDGAVSCNKEPGRYLSNQSVTIVAEPNADSKFTGWSVGGTVLDGGTMVSYSASYTFKLGGDIKLYPNFLRDGYSYIKYNLNGGVLTADGVTDTVIAQVNTSSKPCPNLMADTGEISRDGYILLEFTTNQDGTGLAINPGGLVDIPDSGVLEVWAQWSKWTDVSDFEFTETANSVTITKYKGDDDTVTVPEYINGKPVSGIAQNAFVSKKMHTLILPKTIRTMAAETFVGCSNINTLYIFDTFTSIPDTVFKNCKKFSNLRLNAGRNPSYPVNAESVATRLGYIMTRENYSDKPIILLVGGSSALFGFDSEYLEELLYNNYYVINCGTNAGGCGMLYIEALSSFMREGDIVMNVPEYGNVQFGEFNLYWRTFRATESCYNIYRYVDFSKYNKFFSAMSEFNSSTQARANLSETSYERKNTSLTDYHCDKASTQIYYERPAFGNISINAKLVNDTVIANFNTIISIVQSKGIKYYIGAAPVYDHNLNATDESIAEFVSMMKYYIDAPYISNPQDYRYADNLFYDSQYHLTTEGARLRTAQLAEDILNQLAKE